MLWTFQLLLSVCQKYVLPGPYSRQWLETDSNDAPAMQMPHGTILYVRSRREEMPRHHTAVSAPERPRTNHRDRMLLLPRYKATRSCQRTTFGIGIKGHCVA